MRSEIVLLVENIDVCRYFYRHTLGLGDPVLDSSYMCAFVLNEETFLVLEKNPVNYMEHASAACRFAIHFDDPAALIAKLAADGVEATEAFTRFNKKAWRISDPEGNIIILD